MARLTTRRLAFAIILSLLLASNPSWAGDAARAERLLFEGTLTQAAAALTAELEKNPRDDEMRFALGVAQVGRAFERVLQSLYRGGLGNRIAELQQLTIEMWRPGMPEPVVAHPHAPEPEFPVHPKPERVTRATVEKTVVEFVADLVRAEATLARITNSQVKLPLHLAQMGFDIVGDGKLSDSERIWAMDWLNGDISRNEMKHFVVAVDRGDVHWLRGYCHLAMALGNAMLAVDAGAVIDHSFHQIFPNFESPFPQLNIRPILPGRKRTAKDESAEAPFLFSVYADYASSMWLAAHMPVNRPQYLRQTHKHLKEVIVQSRESWKFILAETDDDHEWLPNPRQKSVVPDAKVTETMVKEWQRVIDECDALLDGRKLMPHWRVIDGRGINLRRVLLEPGKTFEPVLWFHGSAATPYLEKGTLTDVKLWSTAADAFGGWPLLFYALWFN